MKVAGSFNPQANPLSFDGRRMIFGRFTPVIEL
jgi:uncharacterized protein YbaA (DUF1428 family)